MPKNKKIFYGVLVAVVLVVGGISWFLAKGPISPAPPITPERICQFPEEIDSVKKGTVREEDVYLSGAKRRLAAYYDSIKVYFDLFETESEAVARLNEIKSLLTGKPFSSFYDCSFVGVNGYCAEEEINIPPSTEPPPTVNTITFYWSEDNILKEVGPIDKNQIKRMNAFVNQFKECKPSIISQKTGEPTQCETESDCVWVCGCGCINKERNCEVPEGIMYSCYPGMEEDYSCACVDNQCKTIKVDMPAQQVTITTDKTEYGQGETITITIENNLDIPAELRCCPLINFERKEDEKWAPLKQWEDCPCGSPKCLLAPSWSIEAKQKRIEKWDQKLILGCEGLKTVSQEASPGKYRTTATLLKNKGFDEKIYSNEFTIKEKQVVIPQDRATCEEQGGKWGRFGLKPPEAKETCNLPTSDVGKKCSGSDDCEGSCIAELTKEQEDILNKTDEPVYTKGKCTAWRMVFGCHPFVENGKVEGILCVD